MKAARGQRGSLGLLVSLLAIGHFCVTMPGVETDPVLPTTANGTWEVGTRL